MRPKGQSIIEYSILIAVVVAAFLAMQVYVERAAKANLKLIQEKANAQPQLKLTIW